MDPITLDATGSATAATAPNNSFGALTSGDFFSLLISQLTNQDPFEPTDNQELLQQISSIRDIEASTSLTAALNTLLGQERVSSASALIGRYVTSLPDDAGNVQTGMAVGIRIDSSGKPILQLSSGVQLPIDQVDKIESAQQAAQSLIGKQVTGVDGQDPTDPQTVDGIVVSARTDGAGETILELDTGESLRLSDPFVVDAVQA